MTCSVYAHESTIFPLLGRAPGRLQCHEASKVGRARRQVSGMELQIDSTRVGEIGVLTLTGEVDIYTSPALKSALVAAAVDGCSVIVVDLNGVGFIDSSGLGVLVGALRRAREAGGDLRIVSVQESIARILRITGLDRVFAVHPTLDEALGG